MMTSTELSAGPNWGQIKTPTKKYRLISSGTETAYHHGERWRVEIFNETGGGGGLFRKDPLLKAQGWHEKNTTWLEECIPNENMLWWFSQLLCRSYFVGDSHKWRQARKEVENKQQSWFPYIVDIVSKCFNRAPNEPMGEHLGQHWPTLRRRNRCNFLGCRIE